MEPKIKLESCDFHPIVYRVEMEQDCFEQLIHIFVDEILQDATFNKAESAMVSYITRVIEPVGWKAVWRATRDSEVAVDCDFIVEVTDVSLAKLEADVIMKAIVANARRSIEDIDILKDMFFEKWYTVPLIELYPISEGDDDELYARTAVAIEHVRFFYKNLCRPWDGEEDDIIYSEKLIRPRLQLYFDLKNKVLPEVMSSKIKSILNEGWKITRELKRLYTNMNVSDSENELNEDDVLKTLDLRKSLEETQRKMEILENPIMRALIMKKYIPRKSPLKKLQTDGPYTFIVAKQFKYEMLSKLNLDPDTLLQFDHCPEHALKSCSSGDTVLIFPGHYKCDTVGWIDEDVTVKGMGQENSVILEATGNSEVFLSADSNSIHLQNLTLKATSGIVSVIVVHHGHLSMKQCIIDSDEAEIGITILGGAEVAMDSSEVCNAKEDGIQLRVSSSLTMKSSKIISCGRNGIQLDVEDDEYYEDQYTEMHLLDSYIISNEGSGICVNNVPSKDISLKKENGDFSILKMFSWLKHSIENTVLSHNKRSAIGLSVACKPVKNLTPFDTVGFRNRLLSPNDSTVSLLDDILCEDDIFKL